MRTTCFNPRVRAGRDGHFHRFHSRPGVSIHASARDATYPAVPDVMRIQFQSTRPRGTRRLKNDIRKEKSSFNPRVRAGRDFAIMFTLPIAVFQSTRPRGTRLDPPSQTAAQGMFQSTRPRGTRLTPSASGRLTARFNPRVRAGRDALKS